MDQSGYGQFTLLAPFQMLSEVKQTFYLSNFQERVQLVLYSINAKVVPLALRSLSPPGSAAFSCIKLQLLPVVTPVPDSLSHPIPRGNCRLYVHCSVHSKLYPSFQVIRLTWWLYEAITSSLPPWGQMKLRSWWRGRRWWQYVRAHCNEWVPV